jgi:hypothetical protein
MIKDSWWDESPSHCRRNSDLPADSEEQGRSNFAGEVSDSSVGSNLQGLCGLLASSFFKTVARKLSARYMAARQGPLEEDVDYKGLQGPAEE